MAERAVSTAIVRTSVSGVSTWRSRLAEAYASGKCTNRMPGSVTRDVLSQLAVKAAYEEEGEEGSGQWRSAGAAQCRVMVERCAARKGGQDLRRRWQASGSVAEAGPPVAHRA